MLPTVSHLAGSFSLFLSTYLSFCGGRWGGMELFVANAVAVSARALLFRNRAEVPQQRGTLLFCLGWSLEEWEAPRRVTDT